MVANVFLSSTLLFMLQVLQHSRAANRFVIDDDNDLSSSASYVALAPDVCFKPFTEHNKFYKYACVSSTQVEKWSYSDSSCSSGATLEYTYTSSDTSPCGGPAFNCDANAVDNYAVIEFFVAIGSGNYNCDSSILDGADIPVVEGCFCNSAASSYLLECSDVNGVLSGTNTGSTGLTCSNLRAPYYMHNCSFVEQRTVPITLEIAATMTSCVQTITPSPTLSRLTTLPPTVAQPTFDPTADPTAEPTVDIITSTLSFESTTAFPTASGKKKKRKGKKGKRKGKGKKNKGTA